MRARPLAQLRLLLGGLAASGVLVAHLVAYQLLDPHHHVAGGGPATPTSHRMWTFIAAGAMGLTVAGLVRLAFDRTCRRRTPAQSRGSLVGAAALRLVPLQVFGCLAIQVIERWAVGESSGELIAQAMLIGPCLQVLVAFVGAFVLVLFVSAIDLLLARWAPPTFSKRAVHHRSACHYLPPRFQVGSGGGTVRGPPLLA